MEIKRSLHLNKKHFYEEHYFNIINLLFSFSLYKNHKYA